MGADYVEPDLVSTKDGVLVARHENEIGGTTDVADHPEFAGRRATKTIDGVAITGWFTEDFTLAELKTLRAKERIPEIRQRNTIYNGRFEVPTFQEVIDLSKRLSKELDRPIGIYPETKHPTYFRSIGLPLEQRLVRTLNRNDLNERAKVFVQSFEVGNLKALDRELKVPLVQLLSAPDAKPYDFVVPATRARTATSRRRRASRRSRATPTASARRRTTSSRATRPALACRRPRSSPTPTRPACSSTRTRSATRTVPAGRTAHAREPGRLRRRDRRGPAVLRARRRRHVHRQRRHRRRGPQGL